MQYKKYGKYLVMGIIIALSAIVMRPSKDKRYPIRDFAEILKEGILRVTTDYSVRSYHINHEGEAEGFHYQLAREFADAHHLRLEVIPLTRIADQDALLKHGECDIIIGGRPLATSDSTLSHTRPVDINRQIIIQRKPVTPTDSLQYYLRSQVDLAGRTLTIPAGSPFKYRVHHLIEEIGDTIYIHEMPQYGPEQLMALVAHGDLPYAVCDEKTVKAHIHQYPQLDDTLAFGFNQYYTWIVNRHSSVLLDSLNHWIQGQNRQSDTPRREP